MNCGLIGIPRATFGREDASSNALLLCIIITSSSSSLAASVGRQTHWLCIRFDCWPASFVRCNRLNCIGVADSAHKACYCIRRRLAVHSAAAARIHQWISTVIRRTVSADVWMRPAAINTASKNIIYRNPQQLSASVAAFSKTENNNSPLSVHNLTVVVTAKTENVKMTSENRTTFCMSNFRRRWRSYYKCANLMKSANKTVIVW